MAIRRSSGGGCAFLARWRGTCAVCPSTPTIHTLCPAPRPYDRMTVPYRTANRMYDKIGKYGRTVQPWVA
eukprot:361058-Chlamydomonas_euryale.AAC.3